MLLCSLRITQCQATNAYLSGPCQSIGMSVQLQVCIRGSTNVTPWTCQFQSKQSDDCKVELVEKQPKENNTYDNRKTTTFEPLTSWCSNDFFYLGSIGPTTQSKNKGHSGNHSAQWHQKWPHNRRPAVELSFHDETVSRKKWWLKLNSVRCLLPVRSC